MRYRAAPFLSVLLSLALVVAALGHGHAQARAPAPESYALVICGETGLETILIDAHGQPVAPDDCVHGLCSDCLRVVPALSSAGPSAQPMLRSARPAGAFIAPVQGGDIGRTAHRPRAPPSSMKQV